MPKREVPPFVTIPEDALRNSPLLANYEEACLSAPGVLVAVRVGDFYEFFAEHAEIAAEALQITLTGRTHQGGTDADRVAMSGVPVHAVERYLAVLLKAGYRVAIIEKGGDVHLRNPEPPAPEACRVYKYVLQPKTTLSLPVGAEVLSAGVQGEDVVLWAKVSVQLDAPTEARSFAVYGTGHDMLPRLHRFIQTVFMGALVFHVFEVNCP